MARPEHMLALKEHLARPEAALGRNYSTSRPGFRHYHSLSLRHPTGISLQFTSPLDERNIMSRTGPMSSSRALEAILPLISAGQPYEAHQKARTFATRYTKSGAHAIAIDVLFQSARELLKAGHSGSGTDLVILLLDSYDRASESVNDVSRGMFTQVTLKAIA
jgi:hypothetical protein